MAAVPNMSTPAVSAEELSGKERRALRALAGALKGENKLRTLQLAGADISEGFTAQLNDSLRAFELVNIKTRTITKKAECKELAEQLSSITASSVVQVVGHTVLLYRKRKQGETGSAGSIDVAKQLRMRELKAQKAAAKNGLQF